MGLYESWSDLVRSAIVWAGQPDPGLTRQEFVTRSDTETAALRAIITNWPEIDLDGAGLPAAKLLQKLDRQPERVLRLPPRPWLSSVHPGSACFRNRMHSGEGWLTLRSADVGGFCLDSRAGHSGVMVWFVRRMDVPPRPTAVAMVGLVGTVGTVGTFPHVLCLGQHATPTAPLGHGGVGGDGGDDSPRSSNGADATDGQPSASGGDGGDGGVSQPLPKIREAAEQPTHVVGPIVATAGTTPPSPPTPPSPDPDSGQPAKGPEEAWL